jgi:DNA-binding CsgD family transcriptional regulator
VSLTPKGKGAWQTLDPAQRALLALCAEGYSNTEIATIAAIFADAVGMRLHRARRSLAQALHQDRTSSPGRHAAPQIRIRPCTPPSSTSAPAALSSIFTPATILPFSVRQ